VFIREAFATREVFAIPLQEWTWRHPLTCTEQSIASASLRATQTLVH